MGDLSRTDVPVGGAGSGQGDALPVPTLALRANTLQLRKGRPADLGWIDQMQKIHAGKLGFMYARSIQANIEKGRVLVAVDQQGCQFGFVMWTEGYSGREDVTVCYQLAVVPAFHRRLVAASLISGWLAEVPHGTRLAGCWCAQDLPANHFWEAMGFVPMAFRTGSRNRQRPHIWWIRHVRQDDRHPLWFPAKTSGGAIMEERLIVPIPPGHHWSHPVPTVLPTSPDEEVQANGLIAPSKAEAARLTNAAKHPSQRPAIAVAGTNAAAQEARPLVTRQGIKFIGGAAPPPPKGQRKKDGPKRVSDPELKRKLRDLRDRYLDAVESGQLLLPQAGKYQVGRVIDPARLLDGMQGFAAPLSAQLPAPPPPAT